LCIALFSVCDWKVAQINVQRSLIRKIMIYELEQNHNVLEATKSFCCAKGEGAVDHSTVNRWFKKYHSTCRNFDDHAMSGKPKPWILMPSSTT